MGFEPTTIRLELFCSGPLSYGSKVDAYFGSRKATTLFQRSNSFFLEYCCCLGIHVFLPLFRARPEEEAAAAYLIID